MYNVHNQIHRLRDNVRNFRQAYVPGRTTPATAALLICMALIASVWSAMPVSASDVSNYEISIGELNKVKKERPVKKERKERRKKKDESTAQQPSAGAAVSAVAAEKADLAPVSAPVETNKAVTAESAQQPAAGQAGSVSPNKAAALQTSTSPVTIHHDPYSYIRTGKRTVIQAVISSAHAGIRTVWCRFRSSENGSYALVPMVPSPGTHFTFSAVLPGLASASGSLRYAIVAVDESGNEGRSQEFVIAAKPTSVLPGWQLEPSADTIKIVRENKEKPLEGFSDPGIVE